MFLSGMWDLCGGNCCALFLQQIGLAGVEILSLDPDLSGGSPFSK